MGMIPVVGSTLNIFPDNKLRFEISHNGDVIPSLMMQVITFFSYLLLLFACPSSPSL